MVKATLRPSHLSVDALSLGDVVKTQLMSRPHHPLPGRGVGDRRGEDCRAQQHGVSRFWVAVL